jgi:16S rRNA processing protein RimM
MKLENPVLLAQIGAAHGIRGEVRVKPFTEDPLAIGDYGSLWSQDGRKFKITNLRPQKTVVVVKFKGINSREEAEALNRLELFVDRSALPDDTDEDEFYVTDLIGCDVRDEDGTKIGSVMTVPDFGAGPVLEIAPLNEAGGLSSKTYFLDFSLENVPSVDLENTSITVSLPDEVSERD